MRKIWTTFLTALAFSLLLPSSLTYGETNFCWKNTWGRGVGTIPTGCAGGKSNQAGLCYGSCKDGFTGVGPVCWQTCPSGFVDIGVSCEKPASYGRGAGFPWKFGDPLNDTGMIKRCEAAHGRGNCQKWGAVFYPKCKEGFHPVGCCVCSPNCINGMRDDGAFCAKASYGRGAGVIPTVCGPGEENDAGLCYKSCGSTADGVGPVCWDSCPSGWVNCGMGCAKDSASCSTAVVDQVTSVVDSAVSIALLVATAGASSAAKAAGKSGATAAQKLSAPFKGSAWRNIKNISPSDLANAAKSLKTFAVMKGVQVPTTFTKDFTGAFNLAKEIGKLEDDENMTKIEKEHKIAETALNFASFVDPTGIVAVVGSYTKPICKDIIAGRQPANAPTATEVTVASLVDNQRGAVAMAQQQLSVAQDELLQAQEQLKKTTNPTRKAELSRQVQEAAKGVSLASQNLLFAKVLPAKLAEKPGIGARREVGSLQWLGVQPGQAIPTTGVVAGEHKLGPELVVCRADMGDGVHSGKVWNGTCHVGWGGREIAKSTFDVLSAPEGSTEWVPSRPGQPLPSGAIKSGTHATGPTIYVCRADMGDGLHPGKLWRGVCLVGWGGRELARSSYDILVSHTN